MGAHQLATRKSPAVRPQLKPTSWLGSVRRWRLRWMCPAPYVSIDFEPAEPTASNTPAASVSALTRLDRLAVSPRPMIDGGAIRVACLRVFFDCILAVLVCTVPVFMVSIGNRDEPWLWTAPCTSAPIDSAPILGALLLAIGAALWLWHHRLGMQAYSGAFGHPVTKDSPLVGVHGPRRATAAMRRLAILALLLVVLCCAAIQLVVKADIPALIAGVWHHPVRFCSAQDATNWWLSLELPKWQLWMKPAASMLVIGVVLSAVAAFFASTSSRNAEHVSVRMMQWLRGTVTPGTQAELLRVHSYGTPPTGKSVAPYDIVIWLWTMSYLFPEGYRDTAGQRAWLAAPQEVRKKQPIANRDGDDFGVRAVNHRVFYRTAYGPVVVPLLTILAAPLCLYAAGFLKDVPKQQFLISTLVWVAWSAQYVLYITERMASFPHRTYAAEGEEVALLRSHPDYLRLSDSVEDQLWPSMSKTLTLMIGLLLAFVVGWLGAF